MEIKSGGFVTYVISLSRFLPLLLFAPPDLPNWGGVGSSVANVSQMERGKK
jgi:hypothetical protein